MVQINKGVYQVLKIEVLHIIRVKCVYHSVQLASYAVTDYWTSSSAKPTTGFYSFNIFSEQQVLVKNH
jgi:hypothetical protein